MKWTAAHRECNRNWMTQRALQDVVNCTVEGAGTVNYSTKERDVKGCVKRVSGEDEREHAEMQNGKG